MESELQKIVELIEIQNQTLESLLFVAALVFGSLLFVHFGRFMRW